MSDDEKSLDVSVDGDESINMSVSAADDDISIASEEDTVAYSTVQPVLYNPREGLNKKGEDEKSGAQK